MPVELAQNIVRAVVQVPGAFDGSRRPRGKANGEQQLPPKAHLQALQHASCVGPGAHHDEVYVGVGDREGHQTVVSRDGQDRAGHHEPLGVCWCDDAIVFESQDQMVGDG